MPQTYMVTRPTERQRGAVRRPAAPEGAGVLVHGQDGTGVASAGARLPCPPGDRRRRRRRRRRGLGGARPGWWLPPAASSRRSARPARPSCRPGPWWSTAAAAPSSRGSSTPTSISASAARRGSYGGVTTVRDLGWYPAGWLAALRQGRRSCKAAAAAGRRPDRDRPAATRPGPSGPARHRLPGRGRRRGGGGRGRAGRGRGGRDQGRSSTTGRPDPARGRWPRWSRRLASAARRDRSRRLRRRVRQGSAAGVGELAHRLFDPAGLPDALVDALAESVVAVPTPVSTPLRPGGPACAGSWPAVAGSTGPTWATRATRGGRRRAGSLVEAGPPGAGGGRRHLAGRGPPGLAGAAGRAWGPARISCWSTATRWPTCGPFPRAGHPRHLAAANSRG